MTEVRDDAAAVICPRFPAADDGLDFGDGGPRILPGGFCVFAAQLPAALARFAEVKQRARLPGRLPYLCSDLERGAGQQVAGLTRLPAALALGAADDPALCEAAGELTAREARAAGIAVVFAPVLDVADEPENPIVATRAFSADARRVGELAAAFIAGCARGGARATGKHFPGHGSTTLDSHLVLPAISASRDRLDAVELVPFRAAIAAGVPALMIGHLHVTAFDRDVTAASLSSRVIDGVLRRELGFRGVAFTDALDMGAIADGARPEDEPAVRALIAGADVAVLPRDPHRAARAIVASVASGALSRARLAEAAERTRRLVADVDVASEPSLTPAADGAALARRIARAAIVATGPRHSPLRGDVSIGVVDDGPQPSVLPALIESLARAGVRARVAEAPDGPPVDLLVVISEVRGFKGRVLLDADRSARAAAFLAAGARSVASVGCPQAASALAGGRSAWFALDHDGASLAALADALAGSIAPAGRVCWRDVPVRR